MKPDIRIFKDLEKLSWHAAELFVERSAEAIEARGRFLCALNGGNTPARLFELLASDFREQVEWSRVQLFWGDERCVPPSDPGSSYGQAYASFLQTVQIPEDNVHRAKGELAPAMAASEYAKVLQAYAEPGLAFPRFDLVYLGMGEDGHTASLFPGSPVTETAPVVSVTAHYQDRPANRVSLTPPVFNHARLVAFMATGAKKAQTLAEVLSDRFQPELYPAQRIAPQAGQLLWLVDEGAAARLPASLTRQYCEG